MLRTPFSLIYSAARWACETSDGINIVVRSCLVPRHSLLYSPTSAQSRYAQSSFLGLRFTTDCASNTRGTHSSFLSYYLVQSVRSSQTSLVHPSLLTLLCPALTVPRSSELFVQHIIVFVVQSLAVLSVASSLHIQLVVLILARTSLIFVLSTPHISQFPSIFAFSFLKSSYLTPIARYSGPVG